MRIDKWLWVARFYKTRSLAAEAIEKGHVLIHQTKVKPAKIVVLGDEISIRKGEDIFIVHVLNVAQNRLSAKEAAKLYEETAASLQSRLAAQALRKLSPTPRPAKRPDKQQRRQIIQWQEYH